MNQTTMSSIDPLATKHAARKGESGAKWLRGRWLLVWLFPLGYLLTDSAYQDKPNYFWLTLLAAASCAILLTRLGRSPNMASPVWIILGVFAVGYYSKFYWITWVLDTNAEWPFGWLFRSLANSRWLMFRAYEISTWGFVAFCLSGWAVLGWGPRDTPHWDKEQHWDEQETLIRHRITELSIPLLFALAVVVVTTGYAQYATGIAIAGVEAVYLPFRLAGVIVHSRDVTIPALLLLIIWLADGRQLGAMFSVALGMLVLHGLTQMLLLSSRGALLMMLFPLVMLWLLTGRFTARRRNVLLGIFFMAAWLHPVISEYRRLRVVGGAGDVAGAFTEAVGASGEFWSSASKGLTSLIARVVGTDMLLFAAQLGDVSLSFENISYYLFNPTRSLARIFTQDIAGFGPNTWEHLSAPSLLGTFYLVGGSVGVIIGAALWPVFWQLIWTFLQRLRWRSLPVAKSTVLVLIFSFTSEGTIDGIPFKGLIYGASLLLCEFLVREFVFPSPRRPVRSEA